MQKPKRANCLDGSINNDQHILKQFGQEKSTERDKYLLKMAKIIAEIICQIDENTTTMRQQKREINFAQM